MIRFSDTAGKIALVNPAAVDIVRDAAGGRASLFIGTRVVTVKGDVETVHRALFGTVSDDKTPAPPAAKRD